jgi:hypothetical protein
MIGPEILHQMVKKYLLMIFYHKFNYVHRNPETHSLGSIISNIDEAILRADQ